MSGGMSRNARIVLLASAAVALVLVVFLAASWGRPQPWLEDLGWWRLDLTPQQRMVVDQLIHEMRMRGAGLDEIRGVVEALVRQWGVKAPPPGDIELFYAAKTAISTANAVLLAVLLGTYVSMYRRTHSEFTMGLMIFAIVLLLHCLSANPLVQQFFGFRAFGLGPFAMLPDLFTFVGSIILLYLTYK